MSTSRKPIKPRLARPVLFPDHHEALWTLFPKTRVFTFNTTRDLVIIELGSEVRLLIIHWNPYTRVYVEDEQTIPFETQTLRNRNKPINKSRSK